MSGNCQRPPGRLTPYLWPSQFWKERALRLQKPSTLSVLHTYGGSKAVFSTLKSTPHIVLQGHIWEQPAREGPGWQRPLLCLLTSSRPKCPPSPSPWQATLPVSKGEGSFWGPPEPRLMWPGSFMLPGAWERLGTCGGLPPASLLAFPAHPTWPLPGSSQSFSLSRPGRKRRCVCSSGGQREGCAGRQAQLSSPAKSSFPKKEPFEVTAVGPARPPQPHQPGSRALPHGTRGHFTDGLALLASHTHSVHTQ